MGRIESFSTHGSASSGFSDEVQRVRGNFDRLPKEQVAVKRIESFTPLQLTPILNWAYGGPKNWQSTGSYWKDQEKERRWQFQYPNQDVKESWPIETQQAYKNLQAILQWACDSETRKHLDPAPGVPQYDDKGEVSYSIPNWNNQAEVDQAVADLARYYFNSGEPKKITPLLALGLKGELLGVATIRWKGDPYVEPNPRVASIERVIVDPALKRKGIGTTLVATAVEIAFHKRHYDDGKGGKIWAREVRAWIMSDEPAGQWQGNYSFFRKLGFRIYTYAPHWPEFAAGRDIQTDRDAIWLCVIPKWFEEAKRKNNLTICDRIEIAA